MTQMATITSKRQLTIPASMFDKLNWKEGQKVIISTEGKDLKISTAIDLVNRLAGSVKLPARFKGVSIDEIIRKARKEHFNRP